MWSRAVSQVTRRGAGIKASSGVQSVMCAIDASVFTTTRTGAKQFHTTPILHRSKVSFLKETQTYTVQTTRRSVVLKGLKDERTGEFVRPQIIDKVALREERQKNAKEIFRRDHYSHRKQFLVDRYRRVFDSAKVLICVQPITHDAFPPFRHELLPHFKTLHVSNGLVHIEDKSYAAIKPLFQGPTEVLFQTDPTKIFSSLRAFMKATKAHPQILPLGGAIEGVPGVVYDFEDVLKYESKEHIQGSVIPYLNAPAQVIPVLQSPNIQLVRLLQHHVDQLEKNGGAPAAAGEAAQQA